MLPVVTSSSEKRALQTVRYLACPIQAVQTMVKAGKAINMYSNSNNLTKLTETCIITYNFDKGGGSIVASVLCRNIKDRNSTDNCFCIGHVSGPVSKNHQIMNDTFFKNKCPVRTFACDLNDGSLCIFTMT